MIGAGVGAGAGAVSGRQLADWIRSSFICKSGDWSHPGNELFEVVDAVDLDACGGPTAFNESVASEVLRRRGTPTPFSRAIVRAPSRFVITLNYDPLLVDSLRAEGFGNDEFRVLTNNDLEQAFDLACEQPGSIQPTVLHLHGRAEQPETLVLSNASYQRLERDWFWKHLVTFLARKRTLCFIGTRMDEPPFLVNMQAARGEQPHLLLCNHDTAEELRHSRGSISAARHGIHFAVYANHEQIDGFAASLADTVDPPVPGALELLVAGPAPPELYVAAEIRERGEDEETDPTAWAAALFMATRSSAPSITEGELASGHRNLVVGAPGSGKTLLLREVAKQVPSDEFPVLARCADLVPVRQRESLALLVAWAKTGNGARDDVVVNEKALAQRRFHFLLDGLDEVAADQQQALARRIAEVSAQCPQHRFTVASRPVEALAELTAGGWKVLDLRPGEAWQARYLARAGVSLDELEYVMPALRDLRDLLRVPFFLDRIVDLHQRRGLSAFPDMLGLLEALIDEALGRETGLPLNAGLVRGWLREVALAMTLAGAEELPLEELSRVPLPGDVVGSHGEIVRDLVERVMLQERAGGYAFIHRILREALVAEALRCRAPEGALLDVAVPVVRPGMAGVRHGWAVPLALLLPQSGEWRRAVSARDPLAGARATPAGAGKGERENAALLIWRTYVAWRIWIWDYAEPALVDDAHCLARLLRTDLPEVLEEVRQGIDDPSPQVQGNALRVLGFAGIDIEADIRRVLEDPLREPVVRRQAAAAARDLGLEALLPLIVRRALETEDRFEAGDLALVAMRLAPDDQVLEVALALIPGRETRQNVMALAQTRLGGTDLLRLFRSLAEVDDDPLNSDQHALAQIVESLADPIESAVVGDLAFIACRWGARSDQLRAIFEQYPEAALEAFAEATSGDPGRWWEIAYYTGCMSADALEAASAPHWIVATRRADEDEKDEPQKTGEDVPRDTHGEAAAGDDGLGGVIGAPPPTLADALQQPRNKWDGVIMRAAQELAPEASELSRDQRDDLRGRMAEWWPEPFSEAVRHVEGSSWKVDVRAGAWMFYGPALDLDLTPEQWAQVATCGFLFDKQFSWLRRKCTDAAKSVVAEICRDPAVRTWAQALEAMPAPVPREVVDTIVSCAQELGDDAWSIRSIGKRLVESDRPDAVHALSEKSEEFATCLAPVLAAAGDLEIQQRLLARVLREVEGRHLPELGELEWLREVESPTLLPNLFGILSQVVGEPEPEGAYAGDTWGDLSRLVMAAIRRIDGPEAVDGYDRMLARDEDWRFLRLERKAVLQIALERVGGAAGARAAEQLGLPLLRSDDNALRRPEV